MFPEFTAFMWHGDTFEIPAGAVKLFESEACPNQGFIYKGKVLGLQFHPEADEKWIRNLIDNSGHELVEGKIYPGRRGNSRLCSLSCRLQKPDFFPDGLV